ncbi:phospholipid-binding protein [Bordetella genomosp. 9]|uniref:Phospholipid-binding protein n=1 Tax=Bordetella genomosp. 9 TaxID=1416803 RepID=A0A261RLH5_9BORD|nr:BON domain-containing protein [Bordetella genomosp. 9]OZI25904.1 phospholipid-binding protein [Bordetella genomosp. 9]
MTLKPRFPAIALAAALTASVLTLTACAPVVVGAAAAGGAVVATDRRTSGTQLDDQSISLKAEHNISEKAGDAARVNASTYEGVVLLTGEVPNDAIKAEATQLARVEKVRKVVNQLTVGPAASFSVRSNDTWLASKVRTELINTRYVPSGSISITVDKSVVYLQGKVTQAEGEYAANAAAGVSGVAKVVKLFDIISREDAVRLSGGSSGNAPAPADTGAQRAPIETGNGAAETSSAPAGGGAQAMPIR